MRADRLRDQSQHRDRAGFLCDRDEQRARGDGRRRTQGSSRTPSAIIAFFGQHEPGKTNLWESYKNQTAKPVIDDPLASGSQAQNCIGTPAQIRAALQGFEDSGVDQVLFLSQAGRIPHELLSSSIELFGREVLPEIKERDQRRKREKAALVQRLSEKAMRRKPKIEFPAGLPTMVRAAGHH